MPQKPKTKPSLLDKKPFLDLTLLRDKIPSEKIYPFTIPAVSKLDLIEFHPKVTYFVGENGSGKSTLIEALAIQLRINPEGGSKNFNFSTRASHSELSGYIRVGKSGRRIEDAFFLRAESYFNVGTEIERLDEEPARGNRVIDSYGGISLHEQSHGESFFALLQNRLSGGGLYLFDEPESAVSPARQLAMLGIIHQLVEANSQVIIATHSPIVLGYPESIIYQLDGSGISQIKYDDAQCVEIYQSFIRYRERMVAEICADNPEDLK